MDITPARQQGQMVIDGYGEGFFRVAGQRIESAVLLKPFERFFVDVPSYAALNEVHFAALLQNLTDTEALLIGQGAHFQGRLSAPLQSLARQQGLVVDVMDSLAACRTWAVLLGEGRRAAALLWPL